MKNCFTLLFSLVNILAFGQATQQHLTELVEDVSIKDKNYQQTLAFESDNPCLLTLTVVDPKGNEQMYAWNAADMNENRVTMTTKRNEVLVQVETGGSRDLIRIYENGEANSFDDALTIRANDIEHAREIVAELKALSKECGESQKEITIDGKKDPDVTTALNYLKKSIGAVTTDGEEYTQSFIYDAKEGDMVTYEIKSGDGKTLTYLFNIADLNSKDVYFDTKGGGVFVSLETQGGKDLVQVYENDVVDGFESAFNILAYDVEEARRLEKAWKIFISSAEEHKPRDFMAGNPNPNWKQTLDYLMAQVQDVSLGKDAYEQSFSYDQATDMLTYVVIEKDGGDKISYHWHMADINANDIDFETKGSAVMVTMTTEDKRDLIQQVEEEQVQGYENELVIYTEKIEPARDLLNAFKHLAGMAGEHYSSQFIKGQESPGKTATIAYLKQTIGEVKVGDDSYTQSIAEKDDDCLVTFSILNENKGKEEVMSWNMADINAKKTDFSTKGSAVLVTVETQGKRDLIEVVEDGEVDGYESAVSVLAKDVHEARKIVGALKHWAKLCEK